MNETTQTMIRAVLKIGGGYFVAKGIATDEQTETIIAGIIALIAVIWGVLHRSKTPPPPAAGMAAALVLFGFLAFAVAGCQTTPQTASYRAAGATVTTVDTAMSLWGAYVAANHPGQSQEQAVKSAYEKYQAAMTVACDAGASYAATGGTNGTVTAAFNVAIANVGQDIYDLENLIQSFGVKLK